MENLKEKKIKNKISLGILAFTLAGMTWIGNLEASLAQSPEVPECITANGEEYPVGSVTSGGWLCVKNLNGQLNWCRVDNPQDCRPSYDRGTFNRNTSEGKNPEDKNNLVIFPQENSPIEGNGNSDNNNCNDKKFDICDLAKLAGEGFLPGSQNQDTVRESLLTGKFPYDVLNQKMLKGEYPQGDRELSNQTKTQSKFPVDKVPQTSFLNSSSSSREEGNKKLGEKIEGESSFIKEKILTPLFYFCVGVEVILILLYKGLKKMLKDEKEIENRESRGQVASRQVLVPPPSLEVVFVVVKPELSFPPKKRDSDEVDKVIEGSCRVIPPPSSL